MDKRHSIELANGGHATFIGEPTQETVDALNKMVEIAKNMKIEDMNNTQVDYRAEVRKVYDKANIRKHGVFDMWIIHKDTERYLSETASIWCNSRDDAWESAYNRLKSEGKI